MKASLLKMDERGIGYRSLETLGQYTGEPFRFVLNTNDLRPAYQRKRLLPPVHSTALLTEVESLLNAAGLIRPSQSPVAANPLVVMKKDGTARVVIDFRYLNQLTVPDRYPLPSIPGMFHYFMVERKANIFTSLDLARGFNQLPIHEDDCYLTAFHTPLGLMEYVRMPFGVRNGPPSFQRRMEMTLKNTPQAAVFIDDAICGTNIKELKFKPLIPSPLDEDGIATGPMRLEPLSEGWDIQPHLDELEPVLMNLLKDGWRIRWSKSKWGHYVLPALGHYISGVGIQPMVDKVRAIVKMPRPV